MGLAAKTKNVPTDKGRFSRLLQKKVSGSSHTQIPSALKPVRTMTALQELGLAGKKELQARYRLFFIFALTFRPVIFYYRSPLLIILDQMHIIVVLQF